MWRGNSESPKTKGIKKMRVKINGKWIRRKVGKIICPSDISLQAESFSFRHQARQRDMVKVKVNPITYRNNGNMVKRKTNVPCEPLMTPFYRENLKRWQQRIGK